MCGCYSSYAIATPIYVMWKTREPQFAKLQKKYGADIQRWFLNRLPQAAAGATAAAVAATDAVADGAGQDAPAAVPAASQGQQAASKPAKAQNRSKKKRKKVQG